MSDLEASKVGRVKEGIWIPHEDVIRERLQFDLDQIRGITGHMPRDVAMDYESTVTTALTSLDCLLARLQSASRVANAARQFRAIFYLDDHAYGRRSAQTYEAMRALDRALEAFQG